MRKITFFLQKVEISRAILDILFPQNPGVKMERLHCALEGVILQQHAHRSTVHRSCYRSVVRSTSGMIPSREAQLSKVVIAAYPFSPKFAVNSLTYRLICACTTWGSNSLA
jgi:hypothetical protein